MKQHFDVQINHFINANIDDPTMFYIVDGKVEYRALSEVDKLGGFLKYINVRKFGNGFELPIMTRK